MSATAQCNVVRYHRPPRKIAHGLRLEGSLAAVRTLAPVIPIFPTLHFPPKSKIEIQKSKI